VTDVLQPNPVLVVQFTAEAAVLQDVMASAVGDAELAVALPTTVFAACVARTLSGCVPAPATVPENVGLADKTMFPVPVTAFESVTPP
jgi:hypothetical protein